MADVAVARTPFSHLVLLVFEAVLEVVCVSLPGYIAARQGMFDADAQKLVANLNVQLFTPCLIFTKLASQLNASKLVDLAIIPVIFVVQTAVSYLCSVAVSRLFRFSKRPRNFVVAMGVFGNSNSLPISLVISLSQTISGLHWSRVPGDNDDEVSARGILYLLIFQQLGQLVRWSWGYHVLLAPPEKYHEDETGAVHDRLEGGYRDDPSNSSSLLDLSDDSASDLDQKHQGRTMAKDGHDKKMHNSLTDSDLGSGTMTPVNREPFTHSVTSSAASLDERTVVPPVNGNSTIRSSVGTVPHDSVDHITTFPPLRPTQYPDDDDDAEEDEALHSGAKGWWYGAISTTNRAWHIALDTVSRSSDKLFNALPAQVQHFMLKFRAVVSRIGVGLWDFMNPPLWAMLVAIIIASVPALQRLFFSPGTFISNSVTRAVSQSGGVAVPLILVVLGANLARNTLPESEKRKDGHALLNGSFDEAAKNREERNLLIACLVSRMLLPTLIMAPLITLTVKYVPVSILDDPIFVIVCFLITGAPSALQLAQICQINNVYMGVMSRLLFQSYVIWILPSTLFLVTLALKVVDYANK